MLKNHLKVAMMLALSSTYAQADFSQTVFFGDSLTDSGAFTGSPDAGQGGKFTTNPGNVWSENVADYFGTSAVSSNINNPSFTDVENGTNFAQGGAQVSSSVGIGLSDSPKSALPISAQVQNYLNKNPQIDGKALYSIWGGANDVFFQSQLLGRGDIDFNTALASMQQSAADMAGLVQQLSSAGAKNILVPFLPDIGQTPSQVLQVISNAGTDNPNLGDALRAALTALTAPAFNTADQEAAKVHAIANAEIILGLPVDTILNGVAQAVQSSTALATTYNEALKIALANTSANVIYVDSTTLFNEILADPRNAGFVNVLATACSTASSLSCTPNDLITPIGADAFFFADGVHPTKAGHRVIADAMIANIIAPSLISTLYEATLNTLTNNMQFIDQQLSTTRIKESGLTFFAGGSLSDNDYENNAGKSAGETQNITLGAGYHYDNAMYAGFALSTITNDGSFGGKGQFNLTGYQLSGFLSYQTDQFFVRTIASLSTGLELDGVKRKIQLGTSTRYERGETDAKFSSIQANFGFNLVNTDRFKMGPLLGLAYRSVRIDGYREEGNRSTALTFGKQDETSTVGDLGIFNQFHYSKGLVNLNLSRRFDIGNNDRDLQYHLNTLSSNQTMLYGIESDLNSWIVDASVGYQLSKHAAANVGFHYQTGHDTDDQSFNVGVSLDF